jgi:hypothetical protein
MEESLVGGRLYKPHRLMKRGEKKKNYNPEPLARAD